MAANAAAPTPQPALPAPAAVRPHLRRLILGAYRIFLKVIPYLWLGAIYFGSVWIAMLIFHWSMLTAVLSFMMVRAVIMDTSGRVRRYVRGAFR